VATKVNARTNQFEYRRSSYCAAGGCVEVAARPDGTIAIRDAKDQHQPEQVYTREEWVAFIRGAKAGEFDFDIDAPADLDMTTARRSP
jgi:hypothetical protein